MAEYKIELGVKLKTIDIVNQIKASQSQMPKITLDINRKNVDKHLDSIRKQIKNLSNIKVDIGSNSKGGTNNALNISTTNVSSITKSFDVLKESILDIRKALGTLDDGSEMKSLLTSINQIATSLGKATDESETLIKTLNSISKKDFNVNVGIDLGNSKKSSLAYGREARKYIMPQLEEQVAYLENLLGGQNAATGKMFSAGISIEDMDKTLGGMNSKIMIDKMESYEKYIGYLKKAVNAFDPNLMSKFDAQFSKSASQLIDEVTDVKQATDIAEDSVSKFKKIFGSGIDTDSLTKIISDLNEIKEALVKLSSDTSLGGLNESFNGLSKSINDLIANVGNIKTVLDGSFDGVANDVEKTTKVAKQTTDAVSNVARSVSVSSDDSGFKEMSADVNTLGGYLDNLKNKLKSVGFSDASIDSLINEFKELGITVQSVSSKLDANDNLVLTVKGTNNVQQAVTVVGKLNQEVAEGKNAQITLTVDDSKLNSQIKNIKDNLRRSSKDSFDSNFDKQISQIVTNFGKLSVKSEELKGKVENLKIILGQMYETEDPQKLIALNNQLKDSIKNVTNEIKIQQNAEQQSSNSDALYTAKQNALLRLKGLFGENSQAAKMFAADIERIQKEINECGNLKGIRNLNREMDVLVKKADAANAKTQTFGQKFKKQWEQYSSYLSVASVFMYVEQGLRDMFEQVKAIDSAMTELKKVTDETNDAYNKFLSNAAKRAKEIGTTIDGLVESTASFARLGYDFADAQGLAEVANIYTVVGDEVESVEDATTSLISTMAAFKKEMNGMSNADFSLSIVDKLNEVSNNYAITSGGLGEALQRSASSMSVAGNTLDETIALITAANTVVQNPEKVGNAFKTISMRLRAAKTELSEMGEDTEGMAESTASLRAEMLALTGIDLMKTGTDFKGTYIFLEQLAAKWKDLTDIQRASIIELAAGKHQGNVFSSLMENFDIAQRALQTSLNSSGSAMKEHERWSQSLEARLLKLKAAWQSLSQSFLSSNFLKDVLDGVISLVDALDKLINVIGVIPVLLGSFASLKIASTALSGLPKILSVLSSSETKGLFTFANLIKLLRKSFPTLTPLITKFTSALKGMTAGSLVDGVKSLGSSLLGLVTAHPYITAAVLAVTALSTAFTYQKKKAEELAKEVEELTSKYKEEHDELIKIKNDYDTSNDSSMISRYEKLSKGVSAYGKNISLTADEYSEYQGIVNNIAEQFPSLISGYDSQGNALLSCKDNVEELTAAYENLIEVQNKKILNNIGDIEKDFKNVIENNNSTGWWDAFLNNEDGKNLNDKNIKILEDIVKNNYSKDELRKYLSDSYSGVYGGVSVGASEITRALERAGIEEANYWTNTTNDVVDILYKLREENPQLLLDIIQESNSVLETQIEGMKSVADATLSQAFDISSSEYFNMSERLQSIARSVANSWDYDFYTSLQENGTSVQTYVNDMLDQLNAISEKDNAKIEAAFDLQTKFNGGEISYGEYVKNVGDVSNFIDSLDLNEDVKSQIKLDLNTEEITDEYNSLVKRLTSEEIGLNDKEVRNLLNNLSSEEFSVLVGIIPNLDSNATIDKIQSMIDDKMAVEFTFDITGQTEGIEALNNALSESRSAIGLTTESIEALSSRYKDLDGYNASALFEKTAHGVHLNNEELNRLEEQYVSINKLNIDSNLNKLITKYNDLTEEIKNCTDEQKKESLQLQANAYKDKIDELSTLSSQYDGLTSAFNKWQTALEGAEEGDNYDSLFENLESIKELYDKGLVGTDKFKTSVQLMTNEDLSTASIDEIVSAYEKGYPKMQRYFTEGQKGCKNFLKDVSNINSEWAHMNKDGSWEINFNSEEVAKELGVSVDFVLQIAKKLKDYGFEVNLKDTSVKNLQTKIEETEAKLKELGQSPVDINVDIEASSENLGTIESEIEKAKSKIKEINNSSVEPNVKTAQLEDAQAKLEALIDKKIEASQPTFMNLNTSQVNASLVDALEKIQSYQDALNEVNKLSELKEAGITVDDSQIKQAKEKVDECAKAIQGLDGDVKVAIGLEEDGSIDSIKKAFEEGKVKIDADTDPALTKIEQLAENVDRIEDKDVTISVTVNGLDKVKELNKQINLATDIKGDIDKLSDYVESAKALSELDDTIVTYVTANLNGNLSNNKGNIKNMLPFAEGAKALENVKSSNVSVKTDLESNLAFNGSLDKLEQFADGAKALEDVDNVDVLVKANLEANLGLNGSLNKLESFAEGAKSLKDVDDIDVTVKANLEGNLGFNGSLDKLEQFADGAKALEEVKDIDVSVNTNLNGNLGLNGSLDKLDKFADGAKELKDVEDVDVTVKANLEANLGFNGSLDELSKFAEGAKELKDVESQDITINANLNGNLGFNGSLDKLSKFAESAKLLDGVESVDVVVKVNLDGNLGINGSLDKLEQFAKGAESLKEVDNTDVTVKANLDSNLGLNMSLDELSEFAESAKKLDGINSQDVTISAYLNGNLGFNGSLNELSEFAKSAKELDGVESQDVIIKANLEANLGSNMSLDKLGQFSEGAKALDGIESVDVSIKAHLDGNLGLNMSLSELEKFAEGAKSLKDVDSVDVTVSANLNGNLGFNGSLDKLDELAKGAEALKDVKSMDITVKANLDSNLGLNMSLDKLSKFAEDAKLLDGVNSVDVSVKANLDGNLGLNGSLDNLSKFAKNAKELDGIDDADVTVTANLNGSLGTGIMLSQLPSFIKNAKELDDISSSDVTVDANITGNATYNSIAMLEQFNSIATALSSVPTVTVTVNASVDTDNINSAITLLTNLSNSGVLKDYSANISVKTTIDDTVVKNYNAPDKDGKVKYAVDENSPVFTWTAPDKDGVVNYSASVEALTDSQKYKTGTITYQAKISGFPIVNGTANANGTAFVNGSAYKQGNWGAKRTETALTGELGQELVVYGDRYWTVGDNGAEFAKIPKGAIVFNHKQTEELFKNGKITSGGGRGRALVNGTAYNNVNAIGSFYGGKDTVITTNNVTVENKGNSTSPSSNNNDVNMGGQFYNNNNKPKNETPSDTSTSKTNDFKETFDWVEIAIDRLERAIDKLDKKANNVYKKWSTRNSALTSEISKVEDEIELQQKAYDRYMSAATRTGLSESWAKKVRNGSIDISTLTDEKLVEKINEYKEWYLIMPTYLVISM